MVNKVGMVPMAGIIPVKTNTLQDSAHPTVQMRNELYTDSQPKSMISTLQWVHFRWSESEERQRSSLEGGVVRSKAQEWENVGSELTEVSKEKSRDSL